METLSRVKKYEELRKQIENDTVALGEASQEDSQGHVHSINEIDPSIFKKITVNEEAEPYIPERERRDTSSDTFAHTNDDFRNEYLDDFINEVREYNIKKGNRESEDTQTDILNQLNAVSQIKPSYIQSIDGRHVSLDEKEVLSQEAIAAKVKDLIEKEELEPLVKEVICTPFAKEQDEKDEGAISDDIKEAPEVILPEPEVVQAVKEVKEVIAKPVAEQKKTAEDTLCIHMPKSPVSEPVAQEPQEVKPSSKQRKKRLSKAEQKEIEREKKLQQKLVEETQQLRVQLNEYEDDLSDLSEGVVKTNKLLNVILGCLILALLVIIGIIFYWVIQAGGIV